MKSLESKQNLKETNKELPLISIGMLVYNHEKYISDALEGLLSQTYECMELIILDDASTDGTVDVINNYMPHLKKKFKTVKFIKNSRNNGNISQNCNIIERQLKGEYYFSVSGDDIILPDCINSLYQQLCIHPECVLIHANAIYIDDDFHFGGAVISPLYLHEKRLTGIEADTLFQRLMCSNFIVAPTVLMRTEVFTRYGPRNESILFEDYEYWIRLSVKEKFYYLDAPLVLYRRSATSATNFYTEKGETRIIAAIRSDYSTKKIYIDKLSDEAQKQCWETLYITYARECKKFKYMKALALLESLLQNENYDTINNDILDEMLERQQCEINVMEQWNKEGENITFCLTKYLQKRKMFAVAIYGYSPLGRILQEKLCTTGVQVKYIIDKKGKMLDAPLPVYTLDDKLPEVDLIIVAPPGLLRNVGSSIRKKTFSPVCDLVELLEHCQEDKTEINDAAMPQYKECDTLCKNVFEE